MDEIIKANIQRRLRIECNIVDSFEKARSLPVGTIRKRPNGNFIKTVSGWKYHSSNKKTDRSEGSKSQFGPDFSQKEYKEIMSEIEDEYREIFNIPDEQEFTARMCNNGGCDMFAFEFMQRKPSAKKMITHQSDGDAHGHVWVKYKGKFYDAEIPQGVDTIDQIPYIQRAKKINKNVSVEDFD